METTSELSKSPTIPRRLQIILACILVVLIPSIFLAPSVQQLFSTLHSLQNDAYCDLPPSRCEFPLVYNKPPKTGSTKIRLDLVNWSRTVDRRVYRCSAYTRQATFQMRECIPDARDGCAIVATHMWLSESMHQLITSRIGEFKLLTSTRKPSDRIFSYFLQLTHSRSDKSLRNSSSLEQYLTEFNPWTLFNYHTGEGREGSCPLSLQETTMIIALVNRADFVIDVDLPVISNTILKYTNLFELSATVVNQRAQQGITIDKFGPKVQNLLKKVSCVEEEMHRMYRLRMASLYQKATGINCLSNTRYPVPTCFGVNKTVDAVDT